MLHRLGAVFFLLAIIVIILKNFKLIKKKMGVNLHIATGTISALAMIIYSVLDFVKNKQVTILPVGLASILIILSGTDKVRRKCKYLHVVSVICFAGFLTLHIVS